LKIRNGEPSLHRFIKMKQEADRGNAAIKDYAYLYDRVKINRGNFNCMELK